MLGRVEQDGRVIRVAGGAGFIGANFILDWLRVNGGAVLGPAARRPIAGCHQVVRLLPIHSSDYPTPTPKPLNSRLSNDKLGQTFDACAGLALSLDVVPGGDEDMKTITGRKW